MKASVGISTCASITPLDVPLVHCLRIAILASVEEEGIPFSPLLMLIEYQVHQN